MSFWGVEVKPGRPYTHRPQNAPGRLRISQATLGNGSAQNKSTLQCNVGNKRPILLCYLVPDRIESCLLCVEYDESVEVIFSVLGPRSIHLAGYYLRENSEKESEEIYGEDIGDQDTEESDHSSGDNSYEDSFINDDEEKVPPPSPVFAGRGAISDDTWNGKPRRRRLQKKIYVSESDDQNDSLPPVAVDGNASVPRVLDEDEEDKFTISSLMQLNKSCQATAKDTETAGEKNQPFSKDMVEDKLNDFVVPKRKAAVAGVSCDTESPPSPKRRKKRVQDGDALDESAFDKHKSVAKGDIHAFIDEAGLDIKVQLDPSQKRDALDKSACDSRKSLVKGDSYALEDEVKVDNKIQSNPSQEVDSLEKYACDSTKSVVKEGNSDIELEAKVDNKGQCDPSQEVGYLDNSACDSPKPVVEDTAAFKDDAKVNSKVQSDPSRQVDFLENLACDSHNVVVKDDSIGFEDEAKGDNKVQSHPSNDKVIDITIDQHAKSKRKKKIKEENIESIKCMKKKRRAKNRGHEIIENQESENMEIPIPSAVEDKPIMKIAGLDGNSESSGIKTFPDGLVIEELKPGKAEGKVASHGKKVRVHFIGRLKDSEEIIDSNIGQAPFKFRIGGPAVIKGWSIGVDGMRIHGKRKLTIPPSLGYGEEGYGDSIPPNSWLVYEMELAAVL